MFISTGSGLDILAAIFDKPIVFVSSAMIAWTRSTTKKQLTIYKHFVSKKDPQKLNLTKIFDLNLASAETDDIFKKYNIEIIDNNEYEIKDAVKDMLELIKNNFEVSPENKPIQKNFGIFLRKNINKNLNHLHSNFIKSNVSVSFLKK